MRHRDLHQGRRRQLRPALPDASESWRSKNRAPPRARVSRPTSSRNSIQNDRAVLPRRRRLHQRALRATRSTFSTSTASSAASDGEWIVDLIALVRKPTIVSLHTVLPEPSPSTSARRARRFAQPPRRSSCSPRPGSDILLDASTASIATKIHVIHHGVPDVPFSRHARGARRASDFGERSVISTFGLINRGKGLEYAIEAMREVVAAPSRGALPDPRRDASGRAAPRRRGLPRVAGGAGRASTACRTTCSSSTAISISTSWCSYLQATDIYLTPYLNPVQIVSGTLAYAVGCGKAIVSTPYLYAEELLAHGRGFLVRVPRRVVDRAGGQRAARRPRPAREHRAARLPVRPADDVAATSPPTTASCSPRCCPRRADRARDPPNRPGGRRAGRRSITWSR